MNYKAKAKKKWGRKSAWIHGNGRYALLAHCRELTVTLWPKLEDAQEAKSGIDSMACGGRCIKNHEIIDLDLI
jgi:hypothetical protein